MARNRQRAKERQARRKAEQGGATAAKPASQRRPQRETPAVEPDRVEPDSVEPVAAEPEAVEPEVEPDPVEPDPAEPDPVEREQAEILSGAPPQDVGSSSQVLEYEQDLDEEFEDEDFDGDTDSDSREGPRGPRGVRGGRLADDAGDGSGKAAPDSNRPRVVQFLIAVWAELQRVQWPDRQALTTLTGVVLGFVLIAGGYLGLLDAIFSRIIQAIL